jgi:hypothetical protein
MYAKIEQLEVKTGLKTEYEDNGFFGKVLMDG